MNNESQKTGLSTKDPRFIAFSQLVSMYHTLDSVAATFQVDDGAEEDSFRVNMVGTAHHAQRLIGFALMRLSEQLFPQPQNVEDVHEQKPL